MPDSTPPTLGELLRGLQGVTEELRQLAKQQREDRDRYDMRFVPRGEWVEGRRADQSAMRDIAKDVAELRAAEETKAAEARGQRRQLTVGLMVCAAGTFGSLMVALVMLILSGGKP